VLDFAIFFVYIGAVLMIGRLSSRRIGNSVDFHLCGRSLGRFQASLSLAATVFSGSGLIGGAGLAYAIGVSGSYWNLTAVPAWVLVGLTATVTLRRLRVNTVPGYLGQRYGVATQRLIAILQIIEAITFLAVQIMVSSLSLSALFGLNVTVASFLVTVVFVIYTAMGGLWAVVWTDILQYFVLMSAVLLGLTLAMVKVGGWHGLHSGLPASHFSMGQLGAMTPLAWLALCLYSWSTDQAYMQRVFASRDENVARFAYMYTAANYFVFGVAVAGIGMAASVLVPGLKDQDQAFPSLISNIFPHGLRGFFLTGILATTMSTASAYLAAPSSVFVQDLYEPLMRRSLKHHGLLSVSRISIIFLAGIALVVALKFPGVVNAVVFSTIVAPAAIFFPLMLALYWKRTNVKAGFWAILSAAVAGVVSQGWLFGQPPPVPAWLSAIHPLFLGPAVGLAVIATATLLSPETQPQDNPVAAAAAALPHAK